MANKIIEAIVETSLYEGDPLWAISSAVAQPTIRLFSGVTDEDIGSVLLTACLYNQLEIRSSAKETLDAFLAEERFVLPGGLRFSEDEQVKVVPGCCCGLEDWREWLYVPHGKRFVWAGHAPTPRVEYTPDGIRIWQDEKGDDVQFIDFGVDEMRGLLEKVELDLKGFLVRLGKWADFVAPKLRQKIVEHFANNMNI